MYLSKLELETTKAAKWLYNPYDIHKKLWLAFPGRQEGTTAPFLYRLETIVRNLSARLLVLSQDRPDWQEAISSLQGVLHLPEDGQDMKQVHTQGFMQEGRMLRFSLVANPTKKVKDYRRLFAKELKGYPQKWTRQNDKKYQEGKQKLEELKQSVSKEQIRQLPSKKVGLYKESEQVEWLVSKGQNSGFALQEVDMGEGQSVSNVYSLENHFETLDKKNREETIAHNVQVLKVNFTGVLRITDPEKFKTAYTNGIGSGKAFGCGMLLLKRV
ncbi:MAG: type I-E CRISPR-associated protein Cas6/Cse3/CasE [Spirochaetota bacterium]